MIRVVQRSRILFSNPYIFSTWWRKSLIIQTLSIWPKVIHSLKYQRFTTSRCNYIGIWKLVFVIIALLFLYLIIMSIFKLLDLEINTKHLSKIYKIKQTVNLKTRDSLGLKQWIFISKNSTSHCKDDIVWVLSL